jgi:hypothetical protein
MRARHEATSQIQLSAPLLFIAIVTQSTLTVSTRPATDKWQQKMAQVQKGL